jgi:hypothetical protein
VVVALRICGNFSDSAAWRTELSRRGADSFIGSEGTRPAFVMAPARFIVGLRVRFVTRFIYLFGNTGEAPWPLVRKRTIQTNRPPLVGEI